MFLFVIRRPPPIILLFFHIRTQYIYLYVSKYWLSARRQRRDRIEVIIFQEKHYVCISCLRKLQENVATMFGAEWQIEREKKLLLKEKIRWVQVHAHSEMMLEYLLVLCCWTATIRWRSFLRCVMILGSLMLGSSSSSSSSSMMIRSSSHSVCFTLVFFRCGCRTTNDRFGSMRIVRSVSRRCRCWVLCRCYIVSRFRRWRSRASRGRSSWRWPRTVRCGRLIGSLSEAFWVADEARAVFAPCAAEVGREWLAFASAACLFADGGRECVWASAWFASAGCPSEGVTCSATIL